MIKQLLTGLMMMTGMAALAQLPAFPGAEGFGKNASGGRGGRVVAVTNLDDSGEGSFRDALTKFPDEPLTIVFTVGGTIQLKDKVQIKRSNLTIAGQTAPGDGICFTGHSIILNGASSKGNHGNIIIRFIRSRPAGTLRTGLYGFDMENCHDVIIDHCSFSWANEEVAAMYDTKNTTVQWCIISEGLYEAGHQKGHRSYGGVWGGQYASYHHNLFAHLNSRAIRFNGARAHDTAAVVDYRNNVIYNWGNANACYGGEVNIEGGVSQVNIVGNYYKPGPATSSELKFVRPSYQAEKAKGIGQWYLQGNVMQGNKALTKNNAQGVDREELPGQASILSAKPFAIANPLPAQTAAVAFGAVMAGAGAIMPVRDATDTRVVNETRTGTATGIGSFGKPGIIDSPKTFGDMPVYNNGKALPDTDGDGIPDAWEKANGLNPNDAADGNKRHASGYTMLEMYLNGIVKE